MAVNDEIPKSRITLTYRTEVNGEPVDKALPFRVLLMGSFGCPQSETEKKHMSADRKVDLDQRQIRNLDGKNLDSVMKDMQMTLQLKGVPNRLTGQQDAGTPLDISLPITSMKSFSPAEIAQHIPQVKALLLLRKLLLEAQANLDNHKDFRKLVRTLAASKEGKEGIQSELKALNFTDLKLPQLSSGEAPKPQQ
jgi:type VI secretion system protein ImpB